MHFWKKLAANFVWMLYKPLETVLALNAAIRDGPTEPKDVLMAEIQNVRAAEKLQTNKLFVRL